MLEQQQKNQTFNLLLQPQLLHLQFGFLLTTFLLGVFNIKNISIEKGIIRISKEKIRVIVVFKLVSKKMIYDF